MAGIPGILLDSPLDGAPTPEEAPREAEPRGCRPSRYNVRATAADGSLVVWNTFSGALSAFPAERRASVEDALRGRPAAGTEALQQYLWRRGYLVAPGVDERRRVDLAAGRQHYRGDLLELILLASEDCNLRCRYCYESFRRGTMAPPVRAAVRRWVERRAAGLTRLRVSWFGGEPLYGFAAIEELGPFFATLCRERGIELQGHLTTNGLLLAGERLDELLAWGVRDFQVTLDGPPAVHDANRPTRTGGGSFRRIWSNLRAIRRRDDDLLVTIRVNFDRGNLDRLDALLDLLAGELAGDPRFALSFHAVGRWGGERDSELEVCPGEAVPALLGDLRRRAAERGLSLRGTPAELRGPGSQVCYAARPYSFVIGADGRVMKCTVALDSDPLNVVGRLAADGELEIDEHRLALWTAPPLGVDEHCRRCVLLPTCQGLHCPWSRLTRGERPCPPVRRSLKQELGRALAARRDGCRRVAVAAPSPWRADERGDRP